MEFFLKYKYYFIGGIFIILVGLGLTCFLVFNKKDPISSMESIVKTEESIDKVEEESGICLVDIKGAVKNPGVYQLDCSSIVNDVIASAGGLKSTASTLDINLSKKICNEMVIIISTKNQVAKEEKSTQICECESVTINNCEKETITSNEENTIQNNNSINTSVSGKISINTATKEQLMTLSGIGESKAIAIIEYRQTNGEFKSIEDIKNVSGIGDSLFEKIKEHITV